MIEIIYFLEQFYFIEMITSITTTNKYPFSTVFFPSTLKWILPSFSLKSYEKMYSLSRLPSPIFSLALPEEHIYSSSTLMR